MIAIHSVFRKQIAPQLRLPYRGSYLVSAQAHAPLDAGHTGGGFVTGCCARFEVDGRVTIANAGHPSPYCDGREVTVEAGLPLGVVAGVAYEESVVRGERFMFVSDGENGQRELFGFDRTREISMKSAREIAELAKAWGQNDDITVVTVRRKNA